MTSIFYNPEGDEPFTRMHPGQGTVSSIAKQVSDAAIRAAMILQARHACQKWTVMHGKMKDHLLSLRLPPSRLALVREYAENATRPPIDHLGRGVVDNIEWRNGAWLV